MSLDSFHPLVRDWFRSRFAAPTDVQVLGWDAIRSGRHALLCAPTGSGKTLAAFLSCIDALVTAAADGSLADGTQVVYVSPLKALSSDVRRNLEVPLGEIAELAASRGVELAPIRVATRTGDTKASERSRNAKTPPHIWITTPESLFILLGSDSGRRGLASAQTLIVDEIHAVARDKRGSHLALSVERLEHLAGRPLRRIGLSATVSPLEEIACLLVGGHQVDDNGRPDCVIVDRGRRRDMELDVAVPKDELGPIASHELWDETLDRIAELSGQQRTTLVFVNTRRLVERVAHQLTARLGDEAVVAHHGSLSRETRQRAEERLKNGDVRVCVATASLELGIDVGTVDLVCQIGSPRSVSVLLQRVGRSGHAVHATPRGILFPLTRDELIESAAVAELARRGELDRIRLPPWPLDVLAQQLVAACAVESWSVDALYDLVRRSWPYRALERGRYDQVVTMLTEGFDRARGRSAAWLLHDAVNGTVKGRRGARLAALTSGGAIPDNADYDVVTEPEGTFVGRLNEDFAIESSAGDIFLLGNTSWRIRRVERGRVRVEDARGAPPTVPFWLGEAPARTVELSAAVGLLRAAVDDRLDDPELAVAHLIAEYHLSRVAAEQIVAYIVEGKRVLGIVPTATRIVAERFFDEAGGMQLVVHAPLGGRINRAWGLALRKNFCRSFDFELQAAATDDGVNLSLGPQHSFPLEEVFRFVSSKSALKSLRQAVLQSPIFTTRWRWTANRSLAVLRFSSGRKVPPPLQRIRTDDLLAAVFPAQAACQDNAPPGDIELPDHPLVFEAMRDCLHEGLDVDGFIDLLRRIERDEITIHARDTPQPSVFAHQLLNAMPYAFLDDAPLEERRARMVSLRRALPEDARDLGRLDPEAIATASADAWPDARDADELHDALLTLILVADAEIESRFGVEARDWLDALEGAGRIVRDGVHVIATEMRTLARSALDGDDAAIVQVVRGRSSATGPFTSAELGAQIAVPERRVEHACLALEAEGALLRGAFRSVATGPHPEGPLSKEEARNEWCDRRILARIHRATIATLRREIEPVTVATFVRFLVGWQHATRASQLDGADGVLQAVELLQGFEAPIAAWERGLLPARVREYETELLDRLCHGGEVVWGRLSQRLMPESGAIPKRAPLTRVASITLARRTDLEWLLAPADEAVELGSRAQAVRELLHRRGASFAEDIARELGLLSSELDEALGALVHSGQVSADGFAPLRRLDPDRVGSDGYRARARRPSRFARRRYGELQSDGRWWLFERPQSAPDDVIEAIAAQLLTRYGILFRDLLAREPAAPPWRELLPVLRRAEARGELRGGRFVGGRVGEQFASAEAVDALRKVRREEPEGAISVISACDPLNLTGVLTPGPRVPAVATNRLVLRDGIPIAWSDGDGNVQLRDASTEVAEVEAVLRRR